MPDDLMLTALRVLSCYQEHKPPSPEDIQRLRDAAEDSTESRLDADLLACEIITREVRRLKLRFLESCKKAFSANTNN